MKLKILSMMTCCCFLLSVLSCGSNQQNGPRPASAINQRAESLESKLASLDGMTDQDEVRINRFRYLLNELAKNSTSTKEQIADDTMKARAELREKYGKDIKSLALLESTNNIMVRDPKKKSDYAGWLNLIVDGYRN